MHGPSRSLQAQLRTRCRRLRGAALGGAGLSGLPEALAPRQGSAAGTGEAMPRGRQRPAVALPRAPRFARLEVGGRDPACEDRAARGGVCLPDRAGVPAEQGQLVRRDLAQAGEAAGFRPWNRARIQAGSVSKKRCPLSVSRTREGFYSSVSRTRERLSCSVSRSYPGQIWHFLCSVSRTPSRDAISCCSLNRTPRAQFMSRVLYIAHFLRYLHIHRSWSNARWCMAHEGRAWK